MSSETQQELNVQHHNLITVKPFLKYNIGTFQITPFDLKHDVTNYGYILHSILTGKTVLYMTDLVYCRYKFPNVNYWIVECNYIKEIINENVYIKELSLILRNRIIKNHMSLETLKNMLCQNDLTQTKEIYLMHLSDKNSDAERMKKEIQEITGKVVHIA